MEKKRDYQQEIANIIYDYMKDMDNRLYGNLEELRNSVSLQEYDNIYLMAHFCDPLKKNHNSDTLLDLFMNANIIGFPFDHEMSFLDCFEQLHTTFNLSMSRGHILDKLPLLLNRFEKVYRAINKIQYPILYPMTPEE
jgi:hypothetical protein